PQARLQPPDHGLVPGPARRAADGSAERLRPVTADRRPNRGKVACSAPPRPRRSGLRAVGSPVPDRVGGGPPRRAMRRLLLGAAWWSLAAAASAATLPAGFPATPIPPG